MNKSPKAWPPLAKPKGKRNEATTTGEQALATASLASVAELKSEVYNLEKMGWAEGTIARPKSERTTKGADEHLRYTVLAVQANGITIVSVEQLGRGDKNPLKLTIQIHELDEWRGHTGEYREEACAGFADGSIDARSLEGRFLGSRGRAGSAARAQRACHTNSLPRPVHVAASAQRDGATRLQEQRADPGGCDQEGGRRRPPEDRRAFGQLFVPQRLRSPSRFSCLTVRRGAQRATQSGSISVSWYFQIPVGSGADACDMRRTTFGDEVNVITQRKTN